MENFLIVEIFFDRISIFMCISGGLRIVYLTTMLAVQVT